MPVPAEATPQPGQRFLTLPSAPSPLGRLFKIDGNHSLLHGDRDVEGIARLVWGSLNNASVMFTHTCCHSSNGIREDLEGDFMGRG